MYELSFEISAFFLSLFCIVYCLTAKRRQYVPPRGFKNKLTSQHFTYLLMLFTNVLSAAASVLGIFFLSLEGEGMIFWQYEFHALYFVFHSTLSVSFTLYIMNVTGTSLNWKKKTYALFAAPYVISELMAFTNRLTRWVFDIDTEGYHRGPLMVILYACGAFYVIMGFVFFFKNKKAISRADSRAVGVFMVIASLGIVVQALKSTLLVELFCEALACLVIMVVLEEKGGHMEPITGLWNRLAFADANRRMMGSKQKYGIVLVKIMGLDKFINKFSGREADSFLINVASYLTKKSGVDDVYCYRSEDFAVIFKNNDYDRADKFIKEVIERFDSEWTIDTYSVKAEAVASFIKIPEDANTLEELENLISAGYQKDKSGSYFVPVEELKNIMRFSSYESSLKNAIAGGKLKLYYQPIWSVKERRTVSAEALLRVDCDELRNVSPDVYIPIAEKTGLIRDIGLFVFEEVCRFLKNERLKGTDIKYVELNLSVYQFIYSDLVASFEEIRKRYGIDSSLINLEITETAATLEGYNVLDTLNKFMELGYTLSLDDFGTGYSNLIRIIGSKYDNIKIDKTILWNAAKDSGSGMLKNLMSFIKSLGSDIIQEGVETKEQLDLVIGYGCDYVQGYYFSKPVPETEFFDYLETENKR
ncbi:MAG: EAL domain-containing protein [Clostridia bacterium]|nr:EAL domain-containing protein [Clostridia bacterium]